VVEKQGMKSMEEANADGNKQWKIIFAGGDASLNMEVFDPSTSTWSKRQRLHFQ
jgi:hypothetical protein